MNNIGKVFEIFEIHRERFERMMSAGLPDIAYAHLVACQALFMAGMLLEPDAVEVEQMRAAQDAMRSRFFGKG